MNIDNKTIKTVFSKTKKIFLDFIYKLENNSKLFMKKNTKKIKQFKETLTRFKALIGLIFGQLKKAYKIKSNKNQFAANFFELESILQEVQANLLVQEKKNMDDLRTPFF